MSWRIPVTRGTLLLMEALWTYALVAFVVALVGKGGNPSLAGVCAVVFLSYGISRALQDSDLSLGVIRAWGTILSLLLFYAIVRADFFADWRFWDFQWANDMFNHTERTLANRSGEIFGVLLLWGFWMRGILRGQEHLGFDDILSTFGVGVLIIAGVEVFEGSIDDSPALIGQIAIPYAAVGLAAIGLAHAGRASEESKRPFSRVWIAAAGTVIVAVGAVSVVLALFDLVAATEAVQSAGGSLAGVAKSVGHYLAWPLIQVMEVMFAALRWLLTLILGKPNPPVAQTETGAMSTCVQQQILNGLTAEQAAKACEETTRHLPEWVKLIVRFLVALPVVGLIALMTAVLFRRFRKRLGQAETKESTYQEGRLAADLSGFLGNLLNRLRPNIHLGRDHLDPARRLYFDMLDDAEGRGIRRALGQTPLELAPRLQESFHAEVPGRITDAFDDARYGSRPPPEPEVRRLRDEWDAVRDGG